MKRYDTPLIPPSDDIEHTMNIITHILNKFDWVFPCLNLLSKKRKPLQLAGLSDKGSRRKNQDRIYISRFVPDMVVAVACDGLGGEAAGDIAAEVCIKTFKQRFASKKRLEQWLKADELLRKDPVMILQRLMESANHQIVRQTPDSAIMGTTCTAVLIQKKEYSLNLHWAHAGDSRLYLVSDKGIQQITSDDTWIMSKIKNGLMTEKQAENHPKKHHLMNFLGMGNGLGIETGERQLYSGNILIICTDGISNEVPAEQLSDMVSQASPRNACRKLVELARQKGDNKADNMSVIVIKITNLHEV